MQPFSKIAASPRLPDELAIWLDRALGTAEVKRGSAPSRGEDAAENARNAILRALAQRFYRGVPVSTQAARLHALTGTYAFVGWPRDRERAEFPARYRNTPAEYLWAAFKSGAPMTLPQRALRRILIGAPEGDAW